MKYIETTLISHWSSGMITVIISSSFQCYIEVIWLRWHTHSYCPSKVWGHKPWPGRWAREEWGWQGPAHDQRSEAELAFLPEYERKVQMVCASRIRIKSKTRNKSPGVMRKWPYSKCGIEQAIFLLTIYFITMYYTLICFLL